MMGSGEIIYEKVYASPRLPPKISFKDNWRKELGSEVAGGSEDSQQIEPKSIQLLEQGDLLRVRKSTKVSCLTAKAPMKERRDLFPVVCQCLLNIWIKGKTQTKTWTVLSEQQSGSSVQEIENFSFA